ncbi:PSD1 and planctomycete cytochrome C domain-containing protein [Planctomicrobium sp. SH527]|uniref:PSD1 and planctomycete cytochrome C domain-containing protein n=1 Tax=Planctomicrobium sp. SH527 TaxID=3448123 RepID=UPI003F5B4A67
MNRISVSSFLLLAFLFVPVLSLSADDKAEEAGSKGRELFEKQILPILTKSCYECHAKDSAEISGGLELDSPVGMLRGGESGVVIIAHDPKKSLLVRMLRHESGVSAMPPDGKLSDEQISAVEEWIRLGAPDSRQATGKTAREDRFEAALKHWSLQPPQAVTPPEVKQKDWPRGAIDQFVLAKMEQNGLVPVSDAGRRTLIRRVYFDLIGIPPTPAEVDQFLADQSPTALETVIDRLLGSPQFGERWGRHWLDSVRFAESSGLEFNFTYPHAWPYRNYVIDSVNQDKPYDLFIKEQIAGDLLPRSESDTPEVIEARLIAPSMLSFGVKRHTGGATFQLDIVDDQIDTIFRSTQALTVNCSRCHDHKFDPIPTKDYYALAGIFLSTEPLYGTIKQKYSNFPTDLLPIGPNAAEMHAKVVEHQKIVDQADKDLTAKRAEHTKATEAEKAATAKKEEADKLVQAQTTEQVEGPKPEATAALDEAIAALKTATEQAVTLKAEVTTLETKVADLKKAAPPRPQYAMSARDKAKPDDTTIAIRGSPSQRGERVPRGFLSAIKVSQQKEIDKTRSGRLELAEWIANSENPLTARVHVNRIWSHLFGRGLVATTDNFGILGKEPTHPELLDHLALQFMEQGWSVKKAIRTIMLSRTYQLSSERTEAGMKIDPNSQYLWRAAPRRLEAETIRDSILAVSGQLDLNRPVGSTVTGLGDQLAREIPLEKIQPPSNHRSVYLPIVRDYVPEIFDLFDFPSPSLVSGQRSVTNVPSQALYLRNSAFVTDQSRHAARRLLAVAEVTTDEQRADLAAQWAFARQLTEEQRAGVVQLVEKVRQSKPDDEQANVNAWAAWFQVMFSTAEFRYLVDIP